MSETILSLTHSQRKESAQLRNRKYLRICKCCTQEVRWSESAQAWFHKTGDPNTETIARETKKVKI
jgi:histone H3/H4